MGGERGIVSRTRFDENRFSTTMFRAKARSMTMKILWLGECSLLNSLLAFVMIIINKKNENEMTIVSVCADLLRARFFPRGETSPKDLCAGG